MICEWQPKSRTEWLDGRKARVGSSEIGSLFGVDKYRTAYEMFAIKAGLYTPPFPETEIRENSIHLPPPERGNEDEARAMDLLRRLRPLWRVQSNAIPGGSVYIDNDVGLAATPDCFVYDPAMTGRGCIQIKSVAPLIFRKEWMIDGDPEPPVGVTLQAVIDAMLSGSDRAYVAAIVQEFGIDLYLFEIDLARRAPLLAKARELARDFMRRLAENDPYSPDFGRDGAVIAALYADDSGPQVDLSDDARMSAILSEREALKVREADGSDAAKARKIIDTEIIARLGNSVSAKIADGRVVEAKTIRRAPYGVAASSYRQVKVRAAR
jgi:hypothetical protein